MQPSGMLVSKLSAKDSVAACGVAAAKTARLDHLDQTILH